MVKLLDLLKEIGEGSKEPYKYKKVSSKDLDYSVFVFTTEENVDYEMIINKHDHQIKKTIDYEVEFGIGKSISDKLRTKIDYKSTSKDTKTGNIYRIMATLVDIIKKEMVLDKQEHNHTLKSIHFSPTKEDESDDRRLKLYTAYIQKQMPGSEITTLPNGTVTVELPDSQ